MADQIPREYIDNYVSALKKISDANKAALKSALMDIDYYTDMTKAINEVVSVMRSICRGSSDEASILASQFYQGLRSYELGIADGFEAIADGGYDGDATEGAVRAISQKLVDGDEEAFESELMSRVGYETSRSAGNTLYANGKRDPRRPKYARVPQRTRSYANGCPFCQMLASRGFVYSSESAAGGKDPNHYHDGCSCAIVPSWKAKSVEGYNPDDYLEGYQKYLEQDHSKHNDNASGKRRNRYDDNGKLRAGYSGKRIDQM